MDDTGGQRQEKGSARGGGKGFLTGGVGWWLKSRHGQPGLPPRLPDATCRRHTNAVQPERASALRLVARAMDAAVGT